MASIVDEALKPLQSCLHNKKMIDQFNSLTSFRISSTISAMQLNIPQSPGSTQYLLTVFKENLSKLKQF